MTTLRTVATQNDVADLAVLQAFHSMPHYGAITTGRSEHDGYDLLSTEGPNCSAWYLTGYAFVGTREHDGRYFYVWRVTVNGTKRTEYVVAEHKADGTFLVTHAYDGQPAKDRTKTAALAKAAELLAMSAPAPVADPYAPGSEYDGRTIAARYEHSDGALTLTLSDDATVEVYPEAPEPTEHRHEFDGQALVHAHEHDAPHGYFEHPEDPTPPGTDTSPAAYAGPAQPGVFDGPPMNRRERRRAAQQRARADRRQARAERRSHA